LALPQAAYFLFLEAAVGGIIALFWIHLRDQVPRGFFRFTGICLLILAALGLWLRTAFPPVVFTQEYWFAAERTLSVATLILFVVYLLREIRVIVPLIPLLALGSLWAAANVSASDQLLGVGTQLAVLAGAVSLGSVLVALSLGHWYLVSPSMAVQPLIRLSFLCIGALLAQLALLPILGATQLLASNALFLGVRVVFGILVPLPVMFMAWRTARIRSLDSATGLLYIAAALILAGEIAARTLFFLTGIAT
jgi:hypothetical protein